MYIFPNSKIILMQGVPLDNTYTDTVIFDTAQSQYLWFMGEYTKKVFDKQSYQRVNKGTLRVQVNAEEIYSYNYLMFQNTSYGTKWFYAFINQVNYINDKTAEIEYELDVMQTWLFEVRLKPSYVEREHWAEDEPGSNVLPEPVDLGPIVCNQVYETQYFDSYCAVIAVADDSVSTASAAGLDLQMWQPNEEEGGEM